ncbi:hypothetical protein CHARACLAT_021698 [Characodon lateralis]|uniref:Uncharacterized protein n=1 Tax=Characodon lateralis TaxID=208331 RepID=A0ABU7EL64_9TELE|nr:hypothetical protein [Characodon lateralis]
MIMFSKVFLGLASDHYVFQEVLYFLCFVSYGSCILFIVDFSLCSVLWLLFSAHSCSCFHSLPQPPCKQLHWVHLHFADQSPCFTCARPHIFSVLFTCCWFILLCYPCHNCVSLALRFPLKDAKQSCCNLFQSKNSS